jgi:hypothetical protein
MSNHTSHNSTTLAVPLTFISGEIIATVSWDNQLKISFMDKTRGTAHHLDIKQNL